ncbi:Srb7p ASCRUDRAFT_75579 [Ascoidea rubescens DSM 1968]|uniref:Mediator of RNA polymerase II transcription subunit 21 n=1 Tax=Ascoidea rubescens DSM 1968 TaxID=1344418 RepID=A0A1D2VJB1_9ASCO|nr:hypothetical protein ASCRUDRAFT_75579 [Ascoidea rubescens DSM 1968]ODV61587.1 hypothetical protein ASCRUDRAFT_75579 [Ascoidea rubescens DSM 1968]
MSDSQSQIADPKIFENTVKELSTDIILKTRQILKIIESLPGAGVSTDDQLNTINLLQNQLIQLEKKRLQKIDEKNNLLLICNDLIHQVTDGLCNSNT